MRLLNRSEADIGSVAPIPHRLPARDARWHDAIRITAALWSFVLLLYLPRIIALHRGEGLRSVLLDVATIGVSMLLGLGLFAIYRGTATFLTGVRIVVLALAVMALAAANAVFDQVWTALVADSVELGWKALPISFQHGYGATLNYAGVFAVDLALVHLVASTRASRRRERRLAALAASGQRAELDALRLKLNPHFLFNTLNAISAMVVTRRNEEAEAIIERLSSFLRASLASDPTATVAIEQELALVEHYARIEEARFGDRLRFEIDAAPAAEGLACPALIVQPLVEAAIRDGLSATRQPMHLSVETARADDALTVTVRDDAPRGDAPDEETAGTLAGLRRRLDALYEGRASLAFEAGARGCTATVRVPAIAR